MAINIGSSFVDRAAMAGGLSQLLAAASTPYPTTRNVHWSAARPMSNTLPTMFMAPCTELGLRWTRSPSASEGWAIPDLKARRSSPAWAPCPTRPLPTC